jgi:hypothetical protein
MTSRKYNTTVFNEPFDEETIQLIWEKGQIIHGRNSSSFRMDICGAIIERNEYGNTSSIYGGT